MKTSPSLTSSRPLRQRRKVLLPEPDGPITHHLAGLDLAIDAAQDMRLAEALLQLIDLDHRAHRASPLP
jgi:hypothetical protein